MTAANHHDLYHFAFADESRYATLGLGPSFGGAAQVGNGVEGLKQLVAMVPERGQVEWRDMVAVAELDVASHWNGKAGWRLGFEESITYPKCYRAVLLNKANQQKFRLEVLENFAVLPSQVDLADQLPESLYGLMLGFAGAMTEVHPLLLDARLRGPVQDAGKQAWRAPRFSFSLRTATGSPFVERWSFAIQESVSLQPKSFRLWIEQQRTGREIYLFLRQDRTLEGERDVEALPSGVHGAAIGAVLGMAVVQNRLAQAEASGELPSLETALRKANKVAATAPEQREEIEATLARYVDEIRAQKRNENS